MLQQAIDLLEKSSAEELPLADDVIFLLGKHSESIGSLSQGEFKEAAKNAPISTLLRMAALGGGGTTIDGESITADMT